LAGLWDTWVDKVTCLDSIREIATTSILKSSQRRIAHSASRETGRTGCWLTPDSPTAAAVRALDAQVTPRSEACGAGVGQQSVRRNRARVASGRFAELIGHATIPRESRFSVTYASHVHPVFSLCI
jgi:hypothetical protein